MSELPEWDTLDGDEQRALVETRGTRSPSERVSPPQTLWDSFEDFFGADESAVCEYLDALELKGRIYTVGADTCRVAPTRPCVPVDLALFLVAVSSRGCPLGTVANPGG